MREEAIQEEQLEAVLGKKSAPVKRRQRRARASKVVFHFAATLMSMRP